MTNSQKSNFDLEKRTTDYAIKVVRLCRSIPKDSINNRITGQLTGSAGSVGANYREAKEAIHWLLILREANEATFHKEIDDCIKETTELKNILSSIITKCE